MQIDGKSIAVVAAISVGCLLPTAAQAHRLDVWAHVDDHGYILVEVAYAAVKQRWACRSRSAIRTAPYWYADERTWEGNSNLF